MSVTRYTCAGGVAGGGIGTEVRYVRYGVGGTCVLAISRGRGDVGARRPFGDREERGERLPSLSWLFGRVVFQNVDPGNALRTREPRLAFFGGSCEPSD